MSKQDDGGPAFPVPLNPGQSWQGMAPCDGMTLRDYFATHASEDDIAAMRSRVPKVHQIAIGVGVKIISSHKVEPENWRLIARYLHADAMLKARKIGPAP